MKVGLVGFPGSGKSTVFNALTGMSVETGFGSKGKEHLGTVKVPDSRVEALAAIYKPKKTTFAEIVFSDVAGGSSARQLDRAVLNSMREMDALCQVLRAFDNDQAPEPADPMRELVDLEAEIILADLDLVEKRSERLEKERGDARELELMKRLRAQLEAERPLRSLELGEEERKTMGHYRFLTMKPLLYVLNVDESRVAEPVPANIAQAAEERGLLAVVLSAQVEMDIAQMPPEDQPEFLESLGVSELARDRFVRAAFELLDLISMLTAGPDECRAWPIKRGLPAPRAAGKIHSDIERGFIRAEVIQWKDLVQLGSEAKCRDAGKLRVEGKTYVVQDGDVVNFRFNV